MADGMVKEECYTEWLTIAEADVGSAEYLKGMHPMPRDIMCFHCQQCAEKALKGFIVMQNVRPNKTHDLEELRALCESYNQKFDLMKTQCTFLNRYSVVPRYPKEFAVTQDQTFMAIEYAKTVLDFVKALFPDNAGIN
jgi:HEPN domain-containing protein